MSQELIEQGYKFFQEYPWVAIFPALIILSFVKTIFGLITSKWTWLLLIGAVFFYFQQQK